MSSAAQVLDTATFERINPRQQDTGPAVSPAPTPSGRRPGPRWYVVSSYPQAERRAAASLTQKGYETYLPLILVKRRDRVVHTMFHDVEVPLFPAYLFVRFDAGSDPWWPIRYAPGVFRLLTNTGHFPDPVPEGLTEALQAGEELRRHPNRPRACWSPGSACVVAHGPCQGMEGTVLTVRRSIAHVALLMLGQLREVSVDIHHLAPRP